MSCINVLSDSLKAGSRQDKTSSIKGKNASDSLENVTAEFAAMLSGLTNQNADPIGQNSKIAQNLEEGQNSDDSSDQKIGKVVQNLGYGQYMLSFLSQPNVMSDFPAGKEANSGNGEDQGTGEGLSVDGNQSAVALSKLSLDSNEVLTTNGLTSEISQGNRSGITELDKYRQVIADLLVALSGQITDSSPEGASVVSKLGTSERQDLMKLVQGWLTGGDDTSQAQVDNHQLIGAQTEKAQALGSSEGYIPLQEVDLETKLDAEHSKLLNFISLNSRAEDLRQDMIRVLQSQTEGTGDPSVGELNHSLIKGLKPLLDLLITEQGNGSQDQNTKAASLQTALNQVISQVQETSVPQGISKDPRQAKTGDGRLTNTRSDLQQNLADLNFKGSIPAKNVSGVSSEEFNLRDLNVDSKADTKADPKVILQESNELSDVKTSQNQNSSLGMGLGVGSVETIATAIADGKTVAIPVWEQISNAFREQVTSRHRELKELDIQLHPADLGQISIGMRWENGQVHLQVHASEAATSQLLQNQLTELRHTLINQGVNCGTLQMGQQGSDQQQNRQGNEPRRTSDSNANLSEEETEILGVNLFSNEQDDNNRINVKA